jgi:hypothetical protein
MGTESHCGFSFHFLVTGEVEHLSRHLFAIWISSHERLVQVFSPLFWVVCFFFPLPQGLYMLDKHSTTELHPQLWLPFLICFNSNFPQHDSIIVVFVKNLFRYKSTTSLLSLFLSYFSETDTGVFRRC